MTTLGLPSLSRLKLPSLVPVADVTLRALPKPTKAKPEKKPELPYPEGKSLRAGQIAAGALAAGEPAGPQGEKPSAFWTALDKVVQTLDIPGNAIRNALHRWQFTDEEMAAFPTSWTGMKTIPGSAIVAKMGVENAVLQAAIGLGLEVIEDPWLYIGGPAAKGIGTVAGKSFATWTPKVLRSGRATIKDIGEGAVRLSQYDAKRAIEAALGGAKMEGLFGEKLPEIAKEFGAIRAAQPDRAVRFLSTKIQQHLAEGLLNADPIVQKAAAGFFLSHGRRGFGIFHVPLTSAGIELGGVGRHAQRYAAVQDLAEALQGWERTGAMAADAADFAKVTEATLGLRRLQLFVELGTDTANPIADIFNRILPGGRISQRFVEKVGNLERAFYELPQKFPLIGRQKISPLQQQARQVERTMTDNAMRTAIGAAAAEHKEIVDGVLRIAKQEGPEHIQGFNQAVAVRIMGGPEWPDWLARKGVFARGGASGRDMMIAESPLVAAWLNAAPDSQRGKLLTMAAEKAGRYVEMIQELRALGIEIGDLGPGYLPKASTPYGRELIRAAEKGGGRLPKGPLGARRGAVIEQPVMWGQKTKLAEFKGLADTPAGQKLIADEFYGPLFIRDPKSNELQLFLGTMEGEGPFIELWNALEQFQNLEVARLTAAQAGAASDAVTLLAKLEKNWRENPFYGVDFVTREMTPGAVNAYAMAGQMAYRYGTQVAEEVMQTSPVLMYGARTYTHNIQLAVDNLRQYATNMSIELPEVLMSRKTVNGLLDVADPQVQRFLRESPKYVPGMDYRAPRLQAKTDSPFYSAFGKGEPILDAEGNITGHLPMRAVYPAPVADTIERAARIWDDDEEMGRFIAFAHKWMGYWKTGQLLHPSWQVVNLSAIFNAVVGGMRWRALSPDNWRLTSKLFKAARNPESLRGQKMVRGGVTFDLADVLHEMERGGISMSTLSEAETARILAEGVVDRLAANPLTQLQRAGKTATAPLRKLVALNYALNGRIDTQLKMSMFLDALDQGHTVQQAIQRTMTALFDYTDLKRGFERNLMPILVPFYRWTRNNLPWNLYQIIRRPAIYANLPREAQALELALTQHDALPPELRPEWFRQEMGIQFGGDKEGGMGVMVNTMLPPQEVFELIGGVFDSRTAARMIFSTTNPLLQNLAGQAAGVEAFTGKTIEKGAFGPVRQLVGGVRLLREPFRLARIARQGDMRQLVARAILGGRAQRLERAKGVRSLNFESQEAIRTLTREVKKALVKGDKEGADAAYVEVLRWHKLRRKTGLKIPKAIDKVLAQAGP